MLQKKGSCLQRSYLFGQNELILNSNISDDASPYTTKQGIWILISLKWTILNVHAHKDHSRSLHDLIMIHLRERKKGETSKGGELQFIWRYAIHFLYSCFHAFFDHIRRKRITACLISCSTRYFLQYEDMSKQGLQSDQETYLHEHTSLVGTVRDVSLSTALGSPHLPLAVDLPCSSTATMMALPPCSPTAKSWKCNRGRDTWTNEYQGERMYRSDILQKGFTKNSTQTCRNKSNK